VFVKKKTNEQTLSCSDRDSFLTATKCSPPTVALSLKGLYPRCAGQMHYLE